MTTYFVGDLVRLSTALRDIDGDLADGTVSLTVTAPDGTVTTPTPTNDGTGLYHADVTVTQTGSWAYVYASIGAVVVTEPSSFYVYPADTDWIVSLAEAKAHLNVTADHRRRRAEAVHRRRVRVRAEVLGCRRRDRK